MHSRTPERPEAGPRGPTAWPAGATRPRRATAGRQRGGPHLPAGQL